MAIMLQAQCIRVCARVLGASGALASSAYAARRQKHTLPDLPYDYNDLEPHISTEIMRLHHSKHHQTYVNNLVVAEEKMAEAAATGARTHTHACALGSQGTITHHPNTADPLVFCIHPWDLAWVGLTGALFCAGDINTVIQLGPAVRFNGGGHINHSIFWTNLSPNGGGEPDGGWGRL